MFVLLGFLCALLIACAAKGFVMVRRLARKVEELQSEVEAKKVVTVRKANEVARREIELGKEEEEVQMNKEWLEEELALLREEKEALMEREEELKKKEEAQKMDAYDLEEKEDFLNQATRLMEEDQEELEKAKEVFEKAKRAKAARSCALYSVRFGVAMDRDGELCGEGHLGMVQWETSVLRRWNAGAGRT
ncbi:hypothetical protein BSKO_11307 [Bryopsis sp. KO-2023]|nr:hypothetical protein BSKO_11307 [Bryopsis sp. KO-2023]